MLKLRRSGKSGFIGQIVWEWAETELGETSSGTQGQIHGGESYASFADEFFIEGTQICV